ncbi:mevalonate kinase [Acidipropionibacterium thoenii]|uniref:mevalonate kinase n=1 Tax=Acidipropionibacterium thoenii TaxID=1751 RepID=UPI000402D710|nr:mevalonate kinase [Acidipropionibacterium thoenii]
MRIQAASEVSTSPARSHPRSPASGAFEPILGQAHAKAILFGEHAVVYGSPAVAIPLHALTTTAQVRPLARGTRIHSALFHGDADDAPARVQPLLEAIYSAQRHTGMTQTGVELRLDSTVPYERGLGSSAVVGVSVARAIAALAEVEMTEDETFEVAMDCERIAHGRSSGLDPRTVISQVPIRFHGGKVSPIQVGAPLVFVLADSGHAGSTAQAVGAVKASLEADPTRVSGLIDRLGELAEGSLEQLARGDGETLGAQMFEAHRLLAELGVSDVALERLVDAAQAAGATGAKLTGGGRGGCVIALARDDEYGAKLEHVLRSAGAARTWRTTVEAA